VIATHSPQLLSNAKSEMNFVKIIEDGTLIERTPRFYGREINTILYELMDVEERNEPAGCICADILKGKQKPTQCKLFGTACTPSSPVGPCMVSTEGPCSAYYKYWRK
jgi:hydrogenase expression/formation protein HypD